MAMTFKTNLLPDQDLVRELGSSTQRWKINGVTDPKFTDTVTTVTTSGSGNAITAISASNGAITATKGTTFLTSHQDISGKVNKSGDTMTGNLRIKKDNAEIALCDNVNNTRMALEVSNIGRIHGLYSYGYAPTTSTYTDDGKWMLYKNGNGNIIVNGSASENVLKSGDTMTGSLQLQDNSSLVIKTSNIDLTSAPSENAYGTNCITLKDNQNNRVAFIRANQTTANSSSLEIQSARTFDSGNIYNGFNLYVNADKTCTVTVTQPDAWCTGIGAVKKSGDTMTGNLSAPRVYGTQTAGEGQVGVSYNGGKLYLWGNNTSGSAGLYDSNGTYILERDSGTNKYKIYGEQLIIDTGTNPDGNTQGHGVKIWHDAEGGNIGIYAGKNENQQDNYYYEIDGYNGSLRLVTAKNGEYIGTPGRVSYNSENFSLTFNGEIQSTTPNAFRLVQGNYGVILRNDGAYFWILPTASGDPYGHWNQSTVKVRVQLSNGALYGAVWNDYAEFRKNNEKEKDVQQPGRCIKENGDGTLSLTTQRLERGCEIISDTYGFAIGQDEENGYNTPIASNGRVLAYPYESIEEFTNHIGWPVCSGPNGTVSIMTEEEEEKYPSRIIGTISEIPSYEEWGTGKVKVNGRIWIRIK